MQDEVTLRKLQTLNALYNVQQSPPFQQPAIMPNTGNMQPVQNVIQFNVNLNNNMENDINSAQNYYFRNSANLAKMAYVNPAALAK